MYSVHVFVYTCAPNTVYWHLAAESTDISAEEEEEEEEEGEGDSIICGLEVYLHKVNTGKYRYVSTLGV